MFQFKFLATYELLFYFITLQAAIQTGLNAVLHTPIVLQSCEVANHVPSAVAGEEILFLEGVKKKTWVHVCGND